MTSFLPIAINLPGTDVPGGALRSDRFHAGANLVLAPLGGESPPVPTIFQMPALMGGTVARREDHEASRGRGASLADGRSRHRLSGPVERNRHIYGRGACQCAGSDDFLVVGYVVFR
jgi:hypothetical protein